MEKTARQKLSWSVLSVIRRCSRSALSIGAAHFITKPFKPEYAKLVLADILNKKGGQKLRYEYIDPLVASTISVLDSVIQSDISKGRVSLVNGNGIHGTSLS